MVVLVTGGCGYIGSLLIRDLVSDPRFSGDTVRVLDNMMRERYVSLLDLPTRGIYEFVEGDIRKDDDLRRALHDVETVIDLAGITNAPLSFERKELTIDVNVNGGRKVVEHAVRAEVDRFVYSSTASVYGPTKGLVDEGYPCKPISPYAETKLRAEKFCLEATRESGLDSTVLRLGTVYGYSIGIRFDTVVDRFVYLACIGAPLTVWESARTEKRPYLHVSDSVAAILFSLRRSDMKGEIYNVVGENASIKRIIEVIRNAVNNVQVTITPSPNLNQVSYELSNTKIERLGFSPHHSLEQGVRDIVDKFQALATHKTGTAQPVIPTVVTTLSDP